MSGKGSRQRPRQISATEEELRWELAFRCGDDLHRKREILEQLEQLAKQKEGNKQSN